MPKIKHLGLGDIRNAVVNGILDAQNGNTFSDILFCPQTGTVWRNHYFTEPIIDMGVPVSGDTLWLYIHWEPLFADDGTYIGHKNGYPDRIKRPNGMER